MEVLPKNDNISKQGSSEEPGERAGEGRLYVKMPQLSDRCGGSHDDSVMIPVPEGMELPDGAVIVRLDD